MKYKKPIKLSAFLAGPVGRWIMLLLGMIGSGFLCMLMLITYDVYRTFVPTTTSFISASGNQTFSVNESCLNPNCQTATLEIRSDSASAKQLTCDLHSSWDDIDSEDAVVEWSEDEQIIYWKFGSSSGSLNEVDIAADCQ